MNVYVSQELRDRMRECDRVNWSKVATAAFEEAIVKYWEEVKTRKQRKHIRELASKWVHTEPRRAYARSRGGR